MQETNFSQILATIILLHSSNCKSKINLKMIWLTFSPELLECSLIFTLLLKAIWFIIFHFVHNCKQERVCIPQLFLCLHHLPLQHLPTTFQLCFNSPDSIHQPKYTARNTQHTKPNLTLGTQLYVTMFYSLTQKYFSFLPTSYTLIVITHSEQCHTIIHIFYHSIQFTAIQNNNHHSNFFSHLMTIPIHC